MERDAAQARLAEEAERSYKASIAARSSWQGDAAAGAAQPLPETPAAKPPASALRTPASQGRTGRLNLGWSSPFARREMSSPFAQPTWRPLDAEDPEEDATMESVEGRSVVGGDSRIANAPSLPIPPRYKGSTRADRRKFMDEYETYSYALTAFETTHSRPFRMPVAACIEERTRWLIANYEICKPSIEITESMWIDYFRAARDPDITDYEAVDDAMKRLRMDMKVADAESRVTRLVRDMYDVMAKYGLEKRLTDDEPRKLVKYLCDALYPQDFKDRIKTRLDLEANKKYRKDPTAFTHWVTAALRGYMEWEKLTKSTPPTDSKAKGAGGARGGSANPAGGGARDGQPKDAKPAQGAAAPAREGRTGGAGGRPPCLKCQSRDHLVRSCPNVAPGEAEKLLAELGKKRVGRVSKAPPKTPSFEERGVDDAPAAEPRDRGTTRARLGGLLEMDALLDTGADVSMVTRAVLDRLEASGAFLELAKSPVPVKLVPVGKERFEVTTRIKLRDVTLATTAGPLVLPPIECWVDDHSPGESLILGRGVMTQLGYSTDGLLSTALRKLGAKRVEDGALEDAEPPEDEPKPEAEDADSQFRVHQLRSEAMYEPEDAPDDYDERMAFPSPEPASMSAVSAVLMQRHVEAVAAGLPPKEAEMLMYLFEEFPDIFRLTFGCDPPVDVEPLLVRLKPGAVPTKCKNRRMAPLLAEYVARHVKELLDAGLLVRNPRSRWASPPRVVAKATPGDFRMTTDLRGVNFWTEAMHWPMPVLEVVLGYLVKSRVYFNIDADKMFWQLPLHPQSQELFTIMTVFGMYSPTRVMMGQTDAVAFCQATMEKIFEPLLNHEVLVWLDDVLGHAPTPLELVQSLRRTFERCRQFGLKLNPHKCVFYATEIKWCGRVISASGVSHSPERIAGLVAMPPPMTAADLQQFTCAANWMRTSIPEYAKVVAPLMALLEHVMKVAGSRKKRALQRVVLSEGFWEKRHEDAYDQVKKALMAIAPLAHPDDEATVCVFTDASLGHWGATVTQLADTADELPITERTHLPLAFLSGSFVGSGARWPIVEKEAFAIVETCKRLDYLLLRSKGFRLYTDHRNLVYIFDPLATDANMPRYQADKLQRWSTTLMMFRYDIHHISGEDNVWGDLLSRWGAGGAEDRVVQVAAIAVTDMVSPLQSPDFEWPTLEQVLAAQQEDLRGRDSGVLPEVRWDAEQQVYKNESGQVWVPDGAVDLQQRLCVVAHAGAAGHRGQAVTLKTVTDLFHWKTVVQDVNAFVRRCLHCMCVKGEMIPRPYGATLHATKPNEVIHFDFLSLPLGNDTYKYVLVIKDDMSGFVELIECATADAEEVEQGLLDWFKRFGVVHQWVSDQGSHFKNALIEELRKTLGSQHHFVTAYSPWANGTVEVVNRVLENVMKALLSELKMLPGQWPTILPVVQAALNARPANRLGGVAPVTAFTQLPATTTLTALFHPVTHEHVTIEWVAERQREHLEEVAQALDAMHKECADEAERLRQAARDRRENKKGVAMPQFREGDFVLVGQVVTHANKLALRWRGPRRIVRVIHDYTFEVQNLCPPHEISVHHASRLQWYADSQREVTTELLDHVRHGEGGHLMSKLLDIRMGPDTHQLELKVEWVGLDPMEASWERAVELYKDIPVYVQRYADSLAAGDMKNKLMAVIDSVPGVTKTKPKKQPKPGSAKGKKKTKGKRVGKPADAAEKGGGK